MKSIPVKINTLFQSACILGYVKGRNAVKATVAGSGLLMSFTSSAAGSTFGEMINTASEQAKVVPSKGPIFCWGAAFLITAVSVWMMWKTNKEGPSNNHSYGKGFAGILIAALLVSVGFLINTSANSIGADATTF